jgi:DNA-binding transcriptional MerR regulator
MAEQNEGGAGGKELLTLSEVSRRTGISMPTLQRYKKEFQKRIPSVGSGRKQRYPADSLAVFEEIKKENIGKRGRPKSKGAGRGARKTASKRGARKGAKRGGRAAKASSGGSSGLLTLTEVGKRTGISYPTLVRYVKTHGAKIPHEGRGRSRRYHPDAVAVFNELRQQSGRGRKAGSKTKAAGRGKRAAGAGRPPGGDGTLAKRVKALEKSQGDLEKQIRSLIAQLKKPLKVTISRK